MDAESTDKPDKPAVEADPRFPSGPWTGFWLQRRMPGRHWMRKLALRFADGRVHGQGADCVGTFTLDGRYDLSSGHVTIHKRYVGAHFVFYDGQNDDDGRWIWGVWTLRDATGIDRGGFHIWPKAEQDPTARRTSAEQELPAGELELAPV